MVNQTRLRRAVFIRLCNRPIPRVLRMMMVAKDLGLTPYFVGAFREEGLSRHDRWDEWEIERIGPYFPLVNGSKFLLYVFSVIRYGFALLGRLRQLQPRLVHVSDIEAYWPARLYTALTGTPLIFNIHDNLAQRYPCGRFVAWLLNAFEGLAARCATATTVPEEFRRTALPEWCRDNVYVVKNAPQDPGYRAPRAPGDEGVRILYGGWIDAGRGIVPLTGLIARCADCFGRLAGEGNPELVEHVEKAERVDYLGYLNHSQVIEETESCDFVAAFYDPRRPINRFAASNKIAETLAVGRPLLINSEQEIARMLAEYDCAVIADYAEVECLGEELVALRADTERYEAMCRRARQVYEEHYAWEIIYQASLELYAAAGIRAPESGGSAHADQYWTPAA